MRIEIIDKKGAIESKIQLKSGNVVQQVRNQRIKIQERREVIHKKKKNKQRNKRIKIQERREEEMNKEIQEKRETREQENKNQREKERKTKKEKKSGK